MDVYEGIGRYTAKRCYDRNSLREKSVNFGSQFERVQFSHGREITAEFVQKSTQLGSTCLEGQGSRVLAPEAARLCPDSLQSGSHSS